MSFIVDALRATVNYLFPTGQENNVNPPGFILNIEASSPSIGKRQVYLYGVDLELDTVKVIKEKVNELFIKEYGFSTQNKRLLCSGKLLKDDLSLSQQCPDIRTATNLVLV